MLAMDESNPEPTITAQDSAQVHLVFPEIKKNTTAFEVTIQPEPKRIMEVIRLQDGSQSFRVRWKDMWLHEQYITAYPDLLDDFWNKQKEDLVTGSDHSGVSEVTFEHITINGPGSSNGNVSDTYSIHPFLLQVGDDKPEMDSHNVFNDPKTMFNPISGTENPNSNGTDAGNQGFQRRGGDNDIEATNVLGDNHNDLNFSEEVSHVLSNVIPQKCNVVEEGATMNQPHQNEFVKDGDHYSVSNPSEDTIIMTPNDEVILSNSIRSGACDKDAKIRQNIDGNIKHVMKVRSATSDSMEHENATPKRKASACLKKSSKRGKRCATKDGTKVASKIKSPEDEEKENLKECFDNEDRKATENDTNDGVEIPQETSAAPIKGGGKFPYPESKGPCVCDICGKVISNKYGLREHQTVVHFKNGKFECQICGKRVTNKRALNLHMTSHSNERQYVCELCGSSHKTKGNLNYHVKTMHTMIKNFRCDICFKTFKVQAELKEHCFTVHANEGVITCIVCKKKLTTALSIYTHSVMHSGAREHECDICGYAFKTLTGLKEHKITHSDEKPIRQCPYCERKFFSRSQYNAHVMRHTADGSLITYKCPECDVKFQHKSSFNRHVIRHQPGGDLHMRKNPYLNIDEADLPEGVCHKCRKHYSSKSGLYLHLKKCRDGIIQQFQCPYCERGCSNRCSLKRHIQRRHKTIDLEQQRIQGEVMMAKQNLEGVDNSQNVLPHDGMQYGTYFDHGYGNVTVDASQLSTVDLQLLLDTTGATDNESQTATHILSNVGQVSQVTHDNDTTQNLTNKILQLNILTETEAAQFAAQLTQHGVIVRSTGLAHDQGQEQHLIVGATNIDGQTSQLLVSERHAAQLLANAQLDENNTLTLETEQTDLLHDTGVLQFNNNRTAVIQIQHSDVITTQQVLTLSDQQIRNDMHVATELAETLQDISPDNVQVTEVHRSNENKLECDNEVQQYIGEEQIVTNLSENNTDHGYQNLSM